jgi:hypothetical protein
LSRTIASALPTSMNVSIPRSINRSQSANSSSSPGNSAIGSSTGDKIIGGIDAIAADTDPSETSDFV